jgi:hypothetical protein
MNTPATIQITRMASIVWRDDAGHEHTIPAKLEVRINGRAITVGFPGQEYTRSQIRRAYPGHYAKLEKAGDSVTFVDTKGLFNGGRKHASRAKRKH